MEESVGLRSALQEKLGGKESSSEDEEEEEEEENNGEVRAAFLQSCLSKFSKEHGREPSDEERAGIEKTVDAKLRRRRTAGVGRGEGRGALHGPSWEGAVGGRGRGGAQKLAAAEEARRPRRPPRRPATPEEAATDSKKRPREEEETTEDAGPGILEQLMALFKENHGRDRPRPRCSSGATRAREAAEEADAPAYKGRRRAPRKEDNTPRRQGAGAGGAGVGRAGGEEVQLTCQLRVEDRGRLRARHCAAKKGPVLSLDHDVWPDTSMISTARHSIRFTGEQNGYRGHWANGQACRRRVVVFVGCVFNGDPRAVDLKH